jgi:hypothetical protein
MKFKHFTILALIATSTSLVYAKPTQFYKPYKSVNTVENIQPKKYHIETVNVSLASKVDAPTFSTQDQIKERYVQKLTDELKSKGLLADEQTAQPISLSFDIKQKRVFAGEDLKFLGSKAIGKYAHSTLQYTSTMTYDNKDLANYVSSEKISLGKSGSLGKIVRDLSGKGSPDNEIEDIDGFTKYMIEQLPTQ